MVRVGEFSDDVCDRLKLKVSMKVKTENIFLSKDFKSVKNTSTVIPASRKRRHKGNSVVSGETVPADLREGY
jgi:hypothetical protein